MNKIQIYREKAGLTLSELARRCGYKYASRLANYEAGIRRPDIDELRKMIKELNKAGARNVKGRALTIDDVVPASTEAA